MCVIVYGVLKNTGKTIFIQFLQQLLMWYPLLYTSIGMSLSHVTGKEWKKGICLGAGSASKCNKLLWHECWLRCLDAYIHLYWEENFIQHYSSLTRTVYVYVTWPMQRLTPYNTSSSSLSSSTERLLNINPIIIACNCTLFSLFKLKHSSNTLIKFQYKLIKQSKLISFLSKTRESLPLIF